MASAAGIQSASIIQSRFEYFVFQPHQQRLRGNKEDLGHDVLVVETLIKFCHIVLSRHLPLHVFEVEMDLLGLQIIFPDVPEDVNTTCLERKPRA